MRDSPDIAHAIEQVNGIVAAQNAALQSVKTALEGKAAVGGSSGGGINYGKPWVRPSNFPNYDYIDRTNEEALYLTYDCTVAKAFPDVPQYASFAIGGSTAGVIEQGYVDSTGFHAETTYSTSDFSLDSNTVAIQLPTSGRDFVVFRITPSGSSHITVFTFITRDGKYSGTDYRCQYCVEAWGRLPNADGWGYGWAYANGGVIYLESIDIIAPMMQAVKGINTCYNLKNFKVRCATGNLGGQFQRCHTLTSVDLSDWNTSITTTMSNFFDSCYSLVAVDLSMWDVSKVTNMRSMFNYCLGLVSLDLHGWDVSKAENMDALFGNTQMLQKLDISGWSPSAVTNINNLFTNCVLSALDLSGWDTSKVTVASGAFHGCNTLTSLKLTGWTLNTGTNVANMFRYCSSLTDFYPGTFYVSYSFSDSPNLSLDSLARIIEALPTVTTSQTLTLHATAKAKLTEEQIATANTKGWTIA